MSMLLICDDEKNTKVHKYKKEGKRTGMMPVLAFSV